VSPDDRLLTIEEVAEWLRKPKATLYKWRSTGEGPAGFKIGRDLVYRRSAVVRWLAECEAADGRRR
jgi:predicted DNA-binding transcriptional regulator AlpA